MDLKIRKISIKSDTGAEVVTHFVIVLPSLFAYATLTKAINKKIASEHRFFDFPDWEDRRQIDHLDVTLLDRMTEFAGNLKRNICTFNAEFVLSEVFDQSSPPSVTDESERFAKTIGGEIDISECDVKSVTDAFCFSEEEFYDIIKDLDMISSSGIETVQSYDLTLDSIYYDSEAIFDDYILLTEDSMFAIKIKPSEVMASCERIMRLMCCEEGEIEYTKENIFTYTDGSVRGK